MIRLGICDDTSDFLTSVKTDLDNWKEQPETLAISLFTDGDSLIKAHQANPFDIILLDVIMPLLNGMETAAEIRKNDRSVKIVFLTASSDYAVESYTVRANNYLLKPVHKEQLYQCIQDIYDDMMDAEKCISVSTTSAVHRIKLRNIEYIEAHGKKVSFILTKGSPVESNRPFYYYQEKLLLEDGFFKCHRSYIINMYRIATYTKKEIQMQSGTLIPISRNCHNEFESAYFELMFKEGN